MSQGAVEAAWTAWSGSPALVAHIARTAAAALANPLSAPLGDTGGSAASSRIVVEVGHDAEVFATADEFVAKITPEALRGFARLSVVAATPHLSATVAFLRHPGPDIAHRQRVTVSVRALAPGHEEDAVAAARALCLAVRRGFRRWVGRTYGSDELGPVYRGRPVRFADTLSIAAPTFLGFVVGLTAVRTIALLAPHWKPHATVDTIVVLCVGFAYPALWRWALPDVEIAASGQSRLAVALRRTAQTVVGLIAAQIAKKVFGG